MHTKIELKSDGTLWNLSVPANCVRIYVQERLFPIRREYVVRLVIASQPSGIGVGSVRRLDRLRSYDSLSFRSDSKGMVAFSSP